MVYSAGMSESMQRVEQIENVLINHEASNDDIEDVCNLYEGDKHMEISSVTGISGSNWLTCRK